MAATSDELEPSQTARSDTFRGKTLDNEPGVISLSAANLDSVRLTRPEPRDDDATEDAESTGSCAPEPPPGKKFSEDIFANLPGIDNRNTGLSKRTVTGGYFTS
jgi:hypothetical protein